jgi:hypothetical protein
MRMKLFSAMVILSALFAARLLRRSIDIMAAHRIRMDRRSTTGLTACLQEAIRLGTSSNLGTRRTSASVAEIRLVWAG